jgi:hypothetical protein
LIVISEFAMQGVNDLSATHFLPHHKNFLLLLPPRDILA